MKPSLCPNAQRKRADGGILSEGRRRESSGGMKDESHSSPREGSLEGRGGGSVSRKPRFCVQPQWKHRARGEQDGDFV